MTVYLGPLIIGSAIVVEFMSLLIMQIHLSENLSSTLVRRPGTGSRSRWAERRGGIDHGSVLFVPVLKAPSFDSYSVIICLCFFLLVQIMSKVGLIIT